MNSEDAQSGPNPTQQYSAPPQPPPHPTPPSTGGLWQPSLWLLAMLVIVSGIPWFRCETWWACMFLNYSPRYLWLFLSSLLILHAVWRRRWMRLAVCSCCVASLLYSMPWGWGGSGAGQYTILSMNLHNEVERAGQLALVCRVNQVDFLVLQEVHPEMQPYFAKAFSGYQFVSAADDTDALGGDLQDGSGACLIGIHDRVPLQGRPIVQRAITGYRSFATTLALPSSSLQLVCVHTTKPIVAEQGITGLVKHAFTKAAIHRVESLRLYDWVARQGEQPMLLAGDFNAPASAEQVRLPGFQHAHRQSGKAWHLTFPRRRPLIGIDHVLGNAWIRFRSCRTVDMDFSDHRAQLATFDLR